MENKKRIKRLKIIERFADVFLSITLSINVALVVFGPYPIKAISSGDFGDVLGEDYNDELNSIAAKLYEAFPHVDFKVLNKNLKRIRVYDNPAVTEFCSQNDYVYGSYDRLYNVILLRNPNDDHVLSHETIHSAFDDKAIKSFFRIFFDIEEEFLVIEEGLTEFINLEVFGEDEDRSYGTDAVLWAKMICELVDPDFVSSAYFNGDIASIFNELRKLSNHQDDPEKLLTLMNQQVTLKSVEKYPVLEAAKADKEITRYFIEMYFNKVKLNPLFLLDDPLADLKIDSCWSLLTRQINCISVNEEINGFDNERLYYSLCKTLPDELRYKIFDAISGYYSIRGDRYKERYYFIPEKSTIIYRPMITSLILSEDEYLAALKNNERDSYQLKP